ncbi:hypothetical protein J6590_045224 [Homalodisca vitripennis]|nr:hypothetical protein J6590_045224 [Homalodisca vitripennis]
MQNRDDDPKAEKADLLTVLWRRKAAGSRAARCSGVGRAKQSISRLRAVNKPLIQDSRPRPICSCLHPKSSDIANSVKY